MPTVNLDRQRNSYSANCSECKVYVEAQDGFLFKNTKYSSSRGYHVKCEDCYTGVTAKRVKEQAKAARGKSLSLPFSKKWVQSLTITANRDERGVWCEVHNGTNLILGYSDIMGGWQEYPTEEWCHEQAKKLNGTFSDNAINYICEKLSELIEQTLAEDEILYQIEQDNNPAKLIPLQKVVSVLETLYQRPIIEKALIRLRLLNKIELRATKSGVATSLNIETMPIGDVNYGFLKYF